MSALSHFLNAAGLTDAAFAERVGCDRSMINKIKSGKAIPSLSLAIAISGETGIPVEAFAQSQRPAAAHRPDDAAVVAAGPAASQAGAGQVCERSQA